MKALNENKCPLKRTEEQEALAKKFGFYWTELSQIISQIQSECLEVEEAYAKNDRTHLQEEIGDLLQAAACLAIFCNFDPKETLQKSVDKFQKRYDKVVALAEKDGLNNLLNHSQESLLNYWKKAKET